MTRNEQEQPLLMADDLTFLAHRCNSDSCIEIDDEDVLLISLSAAELRRLHAENTEIRTLNDDLFHQGIAVINEKHELLDAAIKAEREACAKVAESYEPRCDVCPSGVSNAIRARGE